MCIFRTVIADLCRQIADLEYELEARLCGASESDREQPRDILVARDDRRALRVLNRSLAAEEQRSAARWERVDREREEAVR